MRSSLLDAPGALKWSAVRSSIEETKSAAEGRYSCGHLWSCSSLSAQLARRCQRVRNSGGLDASGGHHCRQAGYNSGKCSPLNSYHCHKSSCVAPGTVTTTAPPTTTTTTTKPPTTTTAPTTTTSVQLDPSTGSTNSAGAIPALALLSGVAYGGYRLLQKRAGRDSL